MEPNNFLFALVLLWNIPTSWCLLESSYANTSSTSSVTTASVTQAPIYCGTCALYYEVHAHVWWSVIYTAYIASMVYTVDSGTGSTIGSSLRYTPNATAMMDGTNVTAYADWGGIEYTTLNTLRDAELATIMQVNSITMNGSKNGYGVSTQYINSSKTGTAMTECLYSYYGPNPNKTNILPGLPATTAYEYTTVLPFGDESWNTTSAFLYGVNSLASEVATFLDLTVPNCSAYGGGSGTVKIGVTALTSVSISYTNTPQAVSQTPEITPASTSKPQPAPPSSPPAPPTPTTSAPPAPPSSPPAPPTPTASAPPAPTASLQQPTLNPAPKASTSTAIPPGAPNTPGSPNSGSYTTTIVETTSGPSGLETLSETTTVALGSYILSIIGITGATEAATTSTLSSSLGAGSPLTATAPAEFTGSGSRMNVDMSLWPILLILGWSAAAVLL